MANLLSGRARLKDAARFSIVKEWGFARLVGSVLAGIGAMAAANGTELSGMSTEALKAHVVKLAGEIGERNVFRPQALAAAEAYIAGEWQRQGFRVERQVYRAAGVESANLMVTVQGGERPKEIILLGAHYDSERGTPGADDNASGIAALLEISRWFKERKPRRTIRFVAFVNEEMPFYLTGDMGSAVYAKAARGNGDDIRLMMALEMLGYYRDAPGSQSYPPIFRWFYPDRGNFIAFVSNFASWAAVRQAVQAFRAHSDFPVEYTATFASIPGISWSDHASFWKQGYRAFMVTDTAFHRNPNYHLPHDTWDTLDYPRLAQVAAGLARMTEALADADEL